VEQLERHPGLLTSRRTLLDDAPATRPSSSTRTTSFDHTGAIDRIDIEIGEPGLNPDEEAKLHARFAAGKEY